MQYLARRSLWFDEAGIALTVGTSSPVGLLAHSHRFPFLLAEWAATRLGGMNELALRAVPFAAGITLLVAFRRLASRVVEGPVVWFAMALAALSPALIYYANEAKPYSIDALVTVLLLGGALDVLHAAGSRLAWRRLLVGGALALLVSIPAAFLLAGIGIALALAPEVRRRPGAVRRLALALAFLAAVFAALFVALYRSIAANAGRQEWWEASFLRPESPDFLNRTWVAARTVLGEFLAGGLMDSIAVVLVGALCVAGLVAIARRHGRTAAVLLVGPVIAAVAASAAGLYPVAPRTMLFAVPLLVLALAAGVAWLADCVPPAYRTAALGLGGVLWLTPALRADVDRMSEPQWPEANRPAIAEFSGRHRDGEPVYVFGRAVPVWLFYTTDWAAPDTARLRQVTRWAYAPRPAFGSARGAGGRAPAARREFVYPYHGWCELIGVPTGMEWRLNFEVDRPLDPGWADNEATRIHAAARPYAWLFFSHAAGAERTALLDALQRAHGHLVYAFEPAGAELYRVRVDVTPTHGPSGRPREAHHAESSGLSCGAAP